MLRKNRMPRAGCDRYLVRKILVTMEENVYVAFTNMSSRVVSDIQTEAEGETSNGREYSKWLMRLQF